MGLLGIKSTLYIQLNLIGAMLECSKGNAFTIVNFFIVPASSFH